MKRFLPIGSVVLLKEGKKRLMICGRLQTDVSTNIEYDYSGCFYPEGILNSDELFLFNNDNIVEVYAIGFQDEEEFTFRNRISEMIEKDEEEENKK